MKPNPFQISRRSFLKSCTAAAAAAGVPAWFVERAWSQDAQAAPKSPNSRPNMVLIGCGGMGGWDGKNASRFADMVGVCDVDASHAAAAAERYTADGKTPTQFKDFRRVMERKDVDVIVNATPDHWHTLVILAAAGAKKDIYSEKPLTLCIDEGKRIVKAVAQSGIVLQTGTQQRSDGRFHLAAELVRNGRLGKIKEATVWLPAGLRGGPFAGKPVPKELDWDFWQGQTPAVDYVPERCHTNFRYWYVYAGGTLTDWGAHHNDIVRWALGQPGPVQVETKTLAQPIPGGYTAFSEYEVNYTYADGVRHRVVTTRDESIYGEKTRPDGQRNGIRFEGTDGWIWVNREEIKASDPSLLSNPLPDGAVRLYNSTDHMGNFFDCVRTRKAPAADATIGHRSATVCHIGNISMRLGKTLTWDLEKEEFNGENAAEANQYLSREMRKPYDYSMVA